MVKRGGRKAAETGERPAGGEGGIRTPDRLAPMPHFECGAFDHSATSPGATAGDSHRPRSGRVLGEDGWPDKARHQEFRRPNEAKTEQKQWSIRPFGRMAQRS